MVDAERTVEAYLDAHREWRPVLEKLRRVLLAAGLDETVKWGAPCYTHAGANVVGLLAFRNWAALWFHQGALLADADGVLVNAQEGKTKALRHWRFTSAGAVPVRRVAAYVGEAKQLAAEGRAVMPARAGAVVLPEELEAALAAAPAVRAAFAALSPGRRREYAAHVAAAKRVDTRRRRVEKIVPMIASSVGLNDRYRNRDG